METDRDQVRRILKRASWNTYANYHAEADYNFMGAVARELNDVLRFDVQRDPRPGFEYRGVKEGKTAYGEVFIESVGGRPFVTIVSRSLEEVAPIKKGFTPLTTPQKVAAWIRTSLGF